MSKLYVLFSICSTLLLSSVTALPTLEPVEKGLPKLTGKQTKAAWIKTIKTFAVEEDWLSLGLMAKACVDSDISKLSALEEVALEVESEPFQRALRATKNISHLSSKLGITKGELFRLALFLETEFEIARGALGDYLTRRKTGLERSIEYDPESKYIFIHLKTHGLDVLGRGFKKIVTKSILYDVEQPEVVARCSSQISMHQEIAALKQMQGAAGIVKLYASTQRLTDGNVKVYNLMCKLYRGGTLDKALKQNYTFTLQQKLDMALDLLMGLSELHARELVHRDVTSRNVLIDYEKHGMRKSREIHAVIADLGQTKSINDIETNALKAQVNANYIPPEALIPERIGGRAYFATDVYALGCVFHELLHSKKGPWIDKKNLHNPLQPAAVKEAKFIYDLQHYRKNRLSKLKANKQTEPKKLARERFEKLIIKMINPDATRRGKVTTLCKTLQEIIKNYTPKKSAKKKKAPALL